MYLLYTHLTFLPAAIKSNLLINPDVDVIAINKQVPGTGTNPPPISFVKNGFQASVLGFNQK